VSQVVQSGSAGGGAPPKSQKARPIAGSILPQAANLNTLGWDELKLYLMLHCDEMWLAGRSSGIMPPVFGISDWLRIRIVGKPEVICPLRANSQESRSRKLTKEPETCSPNPVAVPTLQV